MLDPETGSLACRLCGEIALELCLRVGNSPTNISRLFREGELSQDMPVDVNVYRCEVCGFVQLIRTLGDVFYDDYLMTATHSPQMRAYQQEQAVRFVRVFGLIGKRVVEVGCGDGNYLSCLHAAGVNVVGVEPSMRFRELARGRGFTIYGGYVGRGTPPPAGPYDGFVSREVLEHVPDPHDFLQGIRRSLRTDAVGLVQVPSLEQTLAGSRFFDFFPDHVNYFSAHTLRLVLERNGFEIEEMTRGMKDEYLVAHVRVKEPSHFEEVCQVIDVLTREVQEFIASNRASGKRIAMWGAGGKGISFLAVARVYEIDYVVDSDPHKQGLYTPVTHLQVVAPEMLLAQPVDAVLITALAYRDEIVRQLRQELRFKGTIAVLGPHLEILEKDS